MTAAFLAGAKGRLLPASLPFRFFAAAAFFHILLWLILLLDAAEAIGWRGGLGPMLAAVHLLTLGVLTTTAIGASVQLLPVATRRALAAVWPIALVFWLTVPGMVMLIAGMLAASTGAMIAGAGLTAIGLLVFALLLADNLRRAQALPVAAAHGWAALAALVGLVTLGVVLAVDYQWTHLPDHGAAALAHLILGGFGFMGMLALGFSHVLVPMFALGAAPPAQPSFVALALACAAISLGAVGALASSTLLLMCAAVLGLAAAGLHIRLMHQVLARGMRKRLGLSFVLVRTAWGMLPAALLVGLAALWGYAGPNGATLFGFVLLWGWLLTFLLGVLQRILPFLASMHTVRSAGSAPPLLSDLAASSPLKLHALCHGLALAALTVAIALDVAWLARVGAAAGLVGALAFAWFSADVMRHVRWRQT
jgi:hypothetical protein